MPEKENPRHIIDILFVLSLFCVFVVSSVILILFGADIYHKTVSLIDYNYSSRTSTAYITEKVRQSDTYNSVYIDNSKGYECLVMTRSIDNVTYATYLYEYNGYLHELFSRTDIELPPDAGQPIIALTNLDFELVSDSLLCISFINNAQEKSEIYVSLHCGAKIFNKEEPYT